MREIHQPGSYSYVFSPYLEPVAHVSPGETVAVFTMDAFENRITKPDDVPSEILGSISIHKRGRSLWMAPSPAIPWPYILSISKQRVTGP